MYNLTIRVGPRETLVPFNVSDLPAVSTDKYQPKTAFWTCGSSLLGKSYMGEYWLQNLQLPSCGDKDLTWIECDPSVQRLKNPMAFFRDFGESRPFLVLYGFTPDSVAYWEHGDKFIYDKNGYLDHHEWLVWRSAAAAQAADKDRQRALELLRGR